MSVATKTTVISPTFVALHCDVCGKFVGKGEYHGHGWLDNPLRKEEEIALLQAIEQRGKLYFEL